MSNELKIEHVLMFVIAAFLLYHMSRCNCNEGFSLGGEKDHCIKGEACGLVGQPKCNGSNTDGRFPPNILKTCNTLQWNDITQKCILPGSGSPSHITKGTKKPINYNCRRPW